MSNRCDNLYFSFGDRSKSSSLGFLATTSRRVGIAGELLSFFARNKRWWMLPVILVVLFSALLIILGQSSALAPFVYALF